MSKNLSKGKDKGQGVKKYNSNDGKINPKWKAIHYGVSASKGSQECGNDHPTSLKQVVDNYDENED